ncbi:hypothetical protein M758_9G167000 [Ceratodon purpureus]|nr:hypothetical protein M758_9G167000 [Ceratodon purpureus]
MNSQALLLRRLSSAMAVSGASLVWSSSSVRIAEAGGRIGVGVAWSRPVSGVRGVHASVGREFEENGGVPSVSGGKGSEYLPPRFSVAPMMDWTDNHYRTLARLISKHAWLYTEMVVADTINHQQDNLDKFLKFPEAQHPIVLQLGGSNPEKLLKASQLASSYEYDEINLNCGCPSDKVAGHGNFGASLMLEPELVGECMAAIAEGSPGTPVTVKCRIGVDNFDSYDLLHKFVSTVSSTSPTQHFIIHARKAILKGLSPAANRSIPPLKYEFVYALIRDFPNLKFTLNGGVVSTHQVNEALHRGAFGVMLGRAAYNYPWGTLGNVDSVVYGDTTPRLTRRQILEKYVEYADAELHKYGHKKPGVRHLVKPLLGLFHAESGAGVWRRAVDDSLRSAETVHALLKETLSVVPDFVLDSPPPIETSPDSLLANLGPLPLAPLYSSFEAFQGVELNSSQFLDSKVQESMNLCSSS